jgi:hypothetical protein
MTCCSTKRLADLQLSRAACTRCIGYAADATQCARCDIVDRTACFLRPCRPTVRFYEYRSASAFERCCGSNLFDKLLYLWRAASYCHHTALLTLFEILEVTSRRSEVRLLQGGDANGRSTRAQ